jgi:hypothetical protein
MKVTRLIINSLQSALHLFKEDPDLVAIMHMKQLNHVAHPRQKLHKTNFFTPANKSGENISQI